MIKLNAIETTVYFLIWSSGVIISLYNLYLAGNEFNSSQNTAYHHDDFAPGWFGRFQDISDFEWTCWTRLTVHLLPWLVVNCAGAEMLRSKASYHRMLPLWYSVITLAATSYVLSAKAAALFLTITLLFHLSVYLRQPVFIWVLAYLWRRYVPSELLGKTDAEVYLIEVATSWLVMRCLAYSLETLGGAKPSFPVLLGYSLYLPTMFCGPLLTFPSFLQQLIAPSRRWTLTRGINIFLAVARCFFWYIFTMVALHFVYVNAILLRPYMVAGMSVWQLAGLGIAMGHFFHLKYLVFYGLPSCWAAAERYPTPPPPCCVSRVYLYSVMWRRFDPGLYSFLVRYIYVPVLKRLRSQHTLIARTAASVACFVFVFVWHGEELYVFYWVLLNLAAVTTEAVGRELYNFPPVRQKVNLALSLANQRRIHCLLACPLHYFSMLSNYFFIGSLEVGKIYFDRASQESTVNTLYIFFFLYGAAQSTVSIEIWERSHH